MSKPYKQNGKWYRFIIVKNGYLGAYEGTKHGIKQFKPDMILEKKEKEKYTDN